MKGAGIFDDDIVLDRRSGDVRVLGKVVGLMRGFWELRILAVCLRLRGSRCTHPFLTCEGAVRWIGGVLLPDGSRFVQRDTEACSAEVRIGAVTVRAWRLRQGGNVMRRMRKAKGLVIGFGVLAAVVFVGVAHASVVDLTLEESACLADPADAGNWRILLRFAVPDALEGATVDLAVLRAELPIDSDEEREIGIEAFPVTCAWSAEEVAWGEDWQSGDGAWDQHRGSISSVITDEHGELGIDVTPIVDQWLRADGGPGGLVLVPFTVGPAAALAAPPPEIALRVWYTSAREHGPSGEGH